MNLMEKVKKHWLVSVILIVVASVTTTWHVVDKVLIGPRDFTIKQLEKTTSKLENEIKRLNKMLKQPNSGKSQPQEPILEFKNESVHILKACIVGKKGNAHDISPQICTYKNPCNWEDLAGGVTLYADLNQEGFAAAYLQDQNGNFFNQEGRLFVRKLKTGSTKLWPGIPGHMAHKDFKLYVVISDKEIPTYTDDKPLKELPIPSNGDIWGPIHLVFRKGYDK